MLPLVFAILAVTVALTGIVGPGAVMGARTSVPTGSTIRGSFVGPESGTLPSVSRTYDLFNSSVEDGYAPYNSTFFPETVAFDALNGTAWVAGGNQGVGTTGVDIVDPATEQGIRVLPTIYDTAVAYDNVSNTMWVANDASSSTVSIYGASNYSLLRTIPAGTDASDLTYDWETNSFYITDAGSVDVVGASNYTSYATVSAGTGEASIVFDNLTGMLYVADRSSDEITYFGQSYPFSTGAISIIQSEEYPQTLLFDYENSKLYASGLSPGVAIIGTNNQTDYATIRVPSGETFPPDGLALNPSNDSLFVADEPGNDVAEFAPAPVLSTSVDQGVTNLSTGADPYGLGFDPTLSDVLVVDNDQSYHAETSLTEISSATNRVVASINLAPLPMGLAYSVGHGEVYVYDGQSGDLEFLSASSLALEHSVFVGFTGMDLAAIDWAALSGNVVYDPVNDTIYVDFVHYLGGASGVAVVNATTYSVSYLPADQFSIPAGMAVDSSDHKVFIADYGNNSVGEIGWGGTIPRNITVGPNPVGLAFDSSNDELYVTNNGNNSVTVIDAATDQVVHWISVGSEPYGITYDPANGFAYVADSDAAELTVINTTLNTAPRTIPLSIVGYPHLLTYDPVNETLIVSVPNPSVGLPGTELEFVNTTNESWFGNLALGQSLTDILWDGATETAFVSATLPGSIYELGTPTGAPPPPTITVTLAAVPSTVQVDGTVSLEANVTGATNTLSYSYSTLPPGCSSTDEAVLPCSPSAVGSYVVGVNVTQLGGGSAAATAVLTVTARTGPLSVSLAAVPSSITLGQGTTFTATVSGGVSPFEFSFTSLPSGCTSVNESSLPCTPSEAGSYSPEVMVTDAHGDVSSGSTSLNVTAAPSSGITATLTDTPSSITLGNSTELRVTLGGNVTGEATYRYSGLPDGCSSVDASTLSCTPSVTGSFTLEVEVNDSAAHFANATASLTVTQTSPAPASTPTNSGIWLWIILAVVIVAALLLIVIWARRRRKPNPAESPPVEAAPPVGPVP